MINALRSTAAAAHNCPPPAPADPPPLGNESPQELWRDGWLGQVPPPEPPRSQGCDCHCEPRTEPDYAVPGLAPDPWSYTPPLYPEDPTLYGG